MAAMTSRERVRRLLSHQEADRVAKRDAIWGATEKLWHKQGLPENQSAFDYFGFEIRALGGDLTPRLPTRVLAEDDEYIIETTPWGGVRRNHKDYSTTPEVIDTPVKTPDDWKKLKPLLQPHFTRVDWASARRNYLKWREAGEYIVFSAATGYDNCQSIINSERLLTLMATEPEFIRDILMTHSRLVAETLKMMYAEGFEFDGVWTYNDMGYRNGPLFSPQMYRDIVMPGEKLIYDTAHQLGMQTIMHSCGNIVPLLPAVIEAGVDCWQTLEVKAGVDVRPLKKQYGGKLAFFGNIDVRAIEDPDPRVIENEIKVKLEAAMPGGGYLFHSDHSIPIDVSFQKYQYVMELVEKYGRY